MRHSTITHTIIGTVGIALLVLGLGFLTGDNEIQAKGDTCAGVWYQSTECGDAGKCCGAFVCSMHPDERSDSPGKCGECKMDLNEEKSCGCESCTKDGACACIAKIKKGTGTIEGIVKSKYLRKAPMVVYLEEMKGKSFRLPPKKPQVDQKEKLFFPYAIPVLKGSTVRFVNADSFDHNVFSPDGEKFDLGNFGKGKFADYTFKQSGVYTLLCRLHPEMVGYVVSVDTPYFAVVDKKSDGTFTLRNVPAGTWKIKVWNERFKKSKLGKTFEVTVKEGKKAQITVKP